jgi:hypothetical protein
LGAGVEDRSHRTEFLAHPKRVAVIDEAQQVPNQNVGEAFGSPSTVRRSEWLGPYGDDVVLELAQPIVIALIADARGRDLEAGAFQRPVVSLPVDRM